MTQNAKKKDMQSTVRQYLVNELQSSSSLTAFDVAEALLVMYDAGVVSAENNKYGEDPLFALNNDATNEQKYWADALYEQIRSAPNDVWNYYVFQGTLH